MPGCRCRGGRARSWLGTPSPSGICASISPATVRRWLSEDALKPWQYRSWIFITDPDFAAKAKRVLDLYDRMWDGKPLGGNDYVISADEKTSIQARCRCHPTLPPGKSRTMRVNHDYTAAARSPTWPPTTCTAAKVFGRCEDTTGIEPFRRLVDQVMTAEPYAGLRPIFGLRTPARIGAMTWSRRVSRAAMVRAAGGGTW